MSLSFDDYQEAAGGTAVYPGQGGFQGLAYAALGLTGEAGETAEQVKKTWRDDGVDLGEQVAGLLTEIESGLKSGLTDQIVMERAFERAYVTFNGFEVGEERRQKIMKELGDTLWYAAQLATELGVSLGDVAQQNLDKLAARAAADKIHGEGSDR